MNHAYSIVYNVALNQYQVVSEKTKTRRSKARKLAALAVLGVLCTPALSVDITAEDTKNVSNSLALNWHDYNFQTNAATNQFFPSDWQTAVSDYVMDLSNNSLIW